MCPLKKKRKAGILMSRNKTLHKGVKKLKQKLITFLLCLMTLAQIFTFSVKNALSKNYGIEEKTITQHTLIATDEDNGWKT